MAGDDENAELETFRKQWQEEVSARAKAASSSSSSSKKPGIILSDSSQGGVNEKEKEKEKKEYTRPPPKVHSVQGDLEKKYDQFVDAGANHDLDQKDDTRRLWLGDRFDKGTTTHGDKEEHGEPSSALEHYEQAVEREAQGNLGDSLKLYRKAYRVRIYFRDISPFECCCYELIWRTVA
jgi:F-box protein 9